MLAFPCYIRITRRIKINLFLCSLFRWGHIFRKADIKDTQKPYQATNLTRRQYSIEDWILTPKSTKMNKIGMHLINFTLFCVSILIFLKHGDDKEI